MVELVIGRAGSGKSEYVLESVREALGTGRKIWLIVPEQQEIVWNNRVARRLPPSAFLQADVCGLTSLASHVFRRTGHLGYKYISRSGKELVMWKALRTVRNRLKVYGRSGGREDRLISLLTGAVAELKNNLLTPADLQRAAVSLRAGDGGDADLLLADRLDDLALIDTVYGALIAASWDDRADIRARVAAEVRDLDFFRGSCVFIDSYYGMTPVQREILASVFRQADRVVMTFALDPDAAGPGGSPELQWGQTRRFYEQAIRLLRRDRIPFEVKTLRENHRTADPALRYLEENLWRYAAEPFQGENRSVSLITASDRYEEADIAAARVRELVAGGARYGDIVVAARQMDMLRGIADVAMARYGIPYYFSERTDVATAPASRLLFSALAVLDGGWRREDLIAMAKTGLCGLAEEETDALERYAEKWNLRGKRIFTDPDGWSMNPDGFTAAWTDTGRAVLAAANAAREKLTPPVEALSEVLSAGQADVRTLTEACHRLLTDFRVREQLAEEADRLTAARRTADASRVSQLWNALSEAFDTMVTVLGTEVCDAGTYARLLRRVITASDVGTIPSGVDEVLLDSAARMRPDEPKHVIVLGAVDGEFPARVQDDGFFSDTDKIKLETEDISLSDPTEAREEEELLIFYRCLCAASETVTLIVPASDGAEPLSPSSGAQRVLALFPDCRRILKETDLIWNEETAAASLTRLAGTGEGAAVRSLLRERGKEPAAGGEISLSDESVPPETAERLFGRRLSLTQSRLEMFVGCHFSYYCRYILKLDEDVRAEMGYADVGNYVHAILERFFRAVKDEALPLGEERKREILDGILAAYEAETFRDVPESPRLRHLLGRLHGSVRLFVDILEDEFSHTEFRPYRFEQKVEAGDGSAPPPLSVPLEDGGEISVHGTIDRLDLYRRDGAAYVRVVDYKTGSKAFKREELKEGWNLQMLLYLFSIWKMPDCSFRREMAGDDEIRPAGVLYTTVKPEPVEAEDRPESAEAARQAAAKAVQRSGALTDDLEILRKMDPELAGRYIPVKLTKDGGFSKKSNVCSQTDFEELYDEVTDTVRRIGTDMRSGDAAALPKRHGQILPCDNCAMLPLCRRDRLGDERENEAAEDGE